MALKESAERVMLDLVVTEISTHETFEQLRDEWNDLLERSRARTIFLTWEWLYSWWCHFGNDLELRLVIVRNVAGELVGIGPFCVGKQYPGVRALRFLGSTCVSSEYLDVICKPELEKAVASLITMTLLDDLDKWDVLILSDVLDTALVFNEIRYELQARKVLLYLTATRKCPYLPLPDQKELFLKNLGGETRSALKRRTKKLIQLGAQVEKAVSAKALPSELETLFALHAKRWVQRGLASNMAQRKIQEFHVDIARQFQEHGWLWLYSLRLNNTTIASLYTFNYAGKIFYYQSGFDPDWAATSPGFVLMGRCIEDAIGDKSTEFDYLRGMEAYKSRWTKIQRTTWELTAVPAGNYRGMIYLWQMQLRIRTKQLIKYLLPRKLLSKR